MQAKHITPILLNVTGIAAALAWFANWRWNSAGMRAAGELRP